MARIESKTLTRRRCASIQRPAARAPHRHALIIGTTWHRSPPFSQLTLPAYDLAGLHAVLTAELGGFEAPAPLCDQPAFHVNMELESFFRDRTADDLLLLYLAGHAVVDERGELALLTHRSERGRWRSSVIDFAFLRDVMAQCSAERQVVILDGCIGSLGGAAPALGTPVDVAAALGTVRVVLSAESRIRFRLRDDAVDGDTRMLAMSPRLVQGLRSGEADIDGDGRVTLDELAAYAHGHPAAPLLPLSRETPGLTEDARLRPSPTRRRSWASHAASSVASWIAHHVGL